MAPLMVCQSKNKRKRGLGRVRVAKGNALIFLTRIMVQSGPERTEMSLSSSGEWWTSSRRTASEMMKLWTSKSFNSTKVQNSVACRTLVQSFFLKSFPFLMLRLRLWLSLPPSRIAPHTRAIKAFTTCAEEAILQMASFFNLSWYDVRIAPAAAGAQMKNLDNLQEKSVCHLFGNLKVVTGRQEIHIKVLIDGVLDLQSIEVSERIKMWMWWKCCLLKPGLEKDCKLMFSFLSCPLFFFFLLNCPRPWRRCADTPGPLYRRWSF